MEALAEYGYIGLFISAFGAATVLPIASEIVFSLLWVKGWDPLFLLGVATSGNVAGSFVNYAIGIFGGHWIMTKLLRLSEKEIHRAEQSFGKYGQSVLLMAWMPIVGDALTVVAGILKVKPIPFFCLVSIGKLVRYLILGWTVTQISN